MKRRDWKSFEHDKTLHELSREIRAIANLLKHAHFTGDLGLDRSCQGLGRVLEKLGNRVKSVSIELQKIKEASSK